MLTVITVSIEDVVTPFLYIIDFVNYFFFSILRIKPPTVPVIPKPKSSMPRVCIKILVWLFLEISWAACIALVAFLAISTLLADGSGITSKMMIAMIRLIMPAINK